MPGGTGCTGVEGQMAREASSGWLKTGTRSDPGMADTVINSDRVTNEEVIGHG